MAPKSSIFLALVLFIAVSTFSLYLISSTHLREEDHLLKLKPTPNTPKDEDPLLQQDPTPPIQQVQEVITPPVLSTAPEGPVKIPYVVSHDVDGEDPLVRQRRNAIKEGFAHAYHGYESQCLGQSELRPVTGGCHNSMFNGLPLTAADSIDTLLIMGLNDEYYRALDHFKANLKWDKQMDVSVFETTIRFVGGFLTAYQMTGENFFLESVTDLVNRLLPAFNTGSGLPRSTVNLVTGACSEPAWMISSAVLAEVGTLQLEFATLSHHTRNPVYLQKVSDIYNVLRNHLPADYLFPPFLNYADGSTKPSTITIGGLGDSYYEYLLKFWLLNEKKDKDIGDWYYKSAQSIIDNLALYGIPSQPYIEVENPDRKDYMYFLSERDGAGRIINRQDHLACFAGGMLGLGSLYIEDENTKQNHLRVAEGLARFCWEMYNKTATGLSPEAVPVNFNGEEIQIVTTNNVEWIMRPEAVETWFILWRITKKQKYRDWGWYIFEAMNKHSRTDLGYSGLRNVNNVPPEKDNVQQSFFMAETMKYLFLLFTPDDVLPLDKFVFNTEAHPLLKFQADAFFEV